MSIKEQINSIIDEESKCRNLTIDFVRGIAIILVVLGHSIQFGSGSVYIVNVDYFDSLLFKVIYSFHMPLFALVSGYLFFWSMKKSTFLIIKEKIISLVVPILCWEFIVRLVIQISKHIYDVRYFMFLYTSKLTESFWFLWSILLCSLIVLIVEKTFKWLKGYSFIYILILIFAMFSAVRIITEYPVI